MERALDHRAVLLVRAVYLDPQGAAILQTWLDWLLRGASRMIQPDGENFDLLPDDAHGREIGDLMNGDPGVQS